MQKKKKQAQLVEASLSERIFRSRHCGTIPIESEGARPLQYKQWCDEKLKRACNEVRLGKISIRRDQFEYGVPKSSIHDHVSGNVQDGAKPGPCKYLNDKE